MWHICMGTIEAQFEWVTITQIYSVRSQSILEDARRG